MHVFITGGSGLTGPAVVAELIAAGHTVTGLARSDDAAARLQALGAQVLPGSLADHGRLQEGARASDGVIHMAFGGSFADPEDLVRRDVTAIEALGRGLVGSGKPFVVTSGTFAMAAGRVRTETDAPDPGSLAHFRVPGEQACLAFADRGVRSSIVRLAPTVHGPGDFGFIPMLIAAARRNGVSAYTGDGANRWPAVHRLDAATPLPLGPGQGPGGTAPHRGGGRGATFETIAHLIGRILQLPTVPRPRAQTAERGGDPFLPGCFATDAPASSARTRAWLGWPPAHPTLLEDMEFGDYFASQPA